ncbi:MAG: leucine-rich repeat domain-containing protein [Clostridiales bacterium]|nr:leucine-rich repeat domain-containing protein [Clostridiales bacterium]
MPKKFIAWVLAAAMSSQMIIPVISYGDEDGTGTSAVNIEDSVSSGSSIVIEESAEITATEIYSSSSSSDTEEIISADFSSEGSCGDNLTYYYDSDTYTLTISGTGKMETYQYYSGGAAPWNGVRSEITTVILEDGITSIGSYAFNGCSSLASINIPDSITSIGGYALQSCTSLASITIPDSVTDFGNYAFYKCAFSTAGPVGGGYDLEFGWTETIPYNALYGCSKV